MGSTIRCGCVVPHTACPYLARSVFLLGTQLVDFRNRRAGGAGSSGHPLGAHCSCRLHRDAPPLSFHHTTFRLHHIPSSPHSVIITAPHGYLLPHRVYGASTVPQAAAAVIDSKAPYMAHHTDIPSMTPPACLVCLHRVHRFAECGKAGSVLSSRALSRHVSSGLYRIVSSIVSS